MLRPAIFVTLFVLSFSLKAQQQAMFTQYMFNGLALNPAYAGSHESISATALSRVQWVGIEGAPTTHTFSVHTPIPSKNIAIGGIFSKDNIGVSSQNSMFLSYAYWINLTNGSRLSFGLQGGLRSNNINYTDLGVNDPNLSSAEGGIKPNIGLGAYWYGARYYLGLSAPTVFQNSFQPKSGSNADLEGFGLTDVSHIYLTGGMLFDLSPIIKLKPSFLIKSVAGAPLELDLNANVIFDDKVWLGLSYRSFDAMSFLFDFQATPQFRLGYAYDYTLSDLKVATSGSHEIMLNYRFVFSNNKIVTPRYF
ncbi:MAG: type IX secretion system membrane protein PorP/SprF [Cyclobacteriaceae bacterium]